MNTLEIYKLAKEITTQEVLNTIAGWEKANDTKSINAYNILVKLGDSMELACATVITEKANDKGISEMYRVAYES